MGIHSLIPYKGQPEKQTIGTCWYSQMSVDPDSKRGNTVLLYQALVFKANDTFLACNDPE